MAKRKENHYNNNVIIDNKVVSVSDLQTNAKSASMRFLVLVLGITLLASMVVPYLSMAAAATSSSNAFNGAVIPGYSMGGLELTAYGVSINSWGAIDAQVPKFVKSNYGIWNAKNVPDNVDDIAQNYKETNTELDQQESSSDNLLNSADRASGWEALTGATNYTNNSPNGSTSTVQNQKYDDISPVRTASDYNYWNAKLPVSNSSNDAKINVSLFPDFVVISKDADNHACVVKSPNDTGDTIVDLSPENKNAEKTTQSQPYYIPISVLMDNYKSELSKIASAPYTMDDLFKAVSNNNSKLDDIVNNSKNNLLNDTIYQNLNGTVKYQGETSNAFNPYPYTMVFSTTDTTKNETVFSSIYENCEAYVYFSPSIVYQKYLQVKNEYLALLNSASRSISNNDAVTTLQIGYYCAAMSILEAYLNESLPQDMTRGYVGMSEDSKVRGKDDGSEIGKLYSSNGNLSFDSGNNKSFQKVTYATLMYDVSAAFSAEAKASSDCNIKDTDAIMDNLSVFGYNIGNENQIMSTGPMKGLNKDNNFERRTNLTPLRSEQEGVSGTINKVMSTVAGRNGELTQAQLKHVTKELKSQKSIAGFLDNSDNAGFYTPCYYPIQQHKMPDSEKTYRFSILADVPYSTFVKYIDAANGLIQGVKLAYSSNFVSSLKSLNDYVSNGSSVSKVELLVQQYNQDNEDTGLDVGEFDASKSIAIAASEQDQDTETGTGAESIETTTESNVQTRVDSALQGYAASNMTSDNVHDMVDIARSTPGLKYETFHRNFNPLKSDGSDQDLFIARVTPAVTTYFPATLVKGYENAGGTEVPTSCTTSNVSFDYFSIGSFAPCFASHSDSKTYYGSLNYELRAFYRKGFISTLSNTSNTPQVEQFNEAKEQVDQVKKDSKISSDTMKTNMKTIFVEAKRLAAGRAIKKLQTYKNTDSGELDMTIVKNYFECFKDQFKASEAGVTTYYNKSDDANYYQSNKGWYYDSDGSEHPEERVDSFEWKDVDSFDFLKKKGLKKIKWHVGQSHPSDGETTETFMGADNSFKLGDFSSDSDADDGILILDENQLGGTQIGSKLADWNNGGEFCMSAVLSKGGDNYFGPIYYKSDKFSVVTTEQYLIQCDKLFTNPNSDYYWMDYHDLEKLDADIAVDKGGDISNGSHNESDKLMIVGYYPKYLFDKVDDSITADQYEKAAEKKLKEACQELFKDVTNQLKDEKLLLSSMPSQMQNVLAWADYQNASDSEGQYQADPTDTVDINLDTNANDDYDAAPSITGLSSLEAAGYTYNPDTCEAVSSDASVGATNSAIQARMERGVEGSTWTYSQQPACYTMTAIIARIENMQNSGVSYPYQNLYTGRFRSGTDQYALLQAHVIDYSSISSGISGDLATRVHGKVVSITNPNYGALPDFLNILGTIGGLIAEATSGFANLTGGMFEDVMWNGNGESATKVATSDNQTGDGTIETKKYDGTGNIERKGSMWVLDSTGGQSFYTLVQSLALVLVLVSLLYIAFKNFYEYTRPAGASAAVGEKDEAGQKSAAAERKILAATQLKVVMPRAIIAVFMIGLPPMSGAGFQGGNFLLLQMLSSIFNQISHVFMNLNGQSVMNLWLNTGADLLSDNPGIGEYIAYGVAMLVIGAMFVVGTLAVLLADVILILFYIIGPLMWALYVWPYNDTTSKTKNPDGIIAKLTSRMKFAWTGGRVGNKAPEGMIECYCETAMLNVMWSVIFWAITIVFTGVTGTIATDTSSTPGNTATLAGAATVSNAAYAKSALMSTGNYYASASVAHADGLFNAGILPMPAWVRMLIAAALAVIVFMLMIKMASSMFKKSLFNTFGAVSAVGGAIRGGAVGGALGNVAKLAKVGQNAAAAVGGAKNIADKARKAADAFSKASVRGKLHQIGKGAQALGEHGSKALNRVNTATKNAGKYLSGDKNLTDGFTNAVKDMNRRLNDNAAANQKDNLKRLNGTSHAVDELKAALGANDITKAQGILDAMTPEQKRQLSHYAPSLFEKNRDGHDLRLKSDVTEQDFDRVKNELNDRIEIAQDRLDRHTQNSNNALTPAQVRANALAASGIDDVYALKNALLSSDSDDRTKRAARNKLDEFSRRMYGEKFDWNKGDAAAANLLDKIPTAEERATRISDAASSAAATGREAASSFAHRHGLSDGDAATVASRELGRVSDTIGETAANTLMTAEKVSSIDKKMTDHVDTLTKVYTDRGFNADEAKERAVLEVASQVGGQLSASEAQRLQSVVSNGGTITRDEAVRLAMTKQTMNLGGGGHGNNVTLSGNLGSTYAHAIAGVNPDALNPAAKAAGMRIQNAEAYQNYANSYAIDSSAYAAGLNSMMDGMSRRDRRELTAAINDSPLATIFTSNASMSRDDINRIIEREAAKGTPISQNVVSAVNTLYSNVSTRAFENDTAFKSGLASVVSGYSSADDAFNELSNYSNDNYESDTAMIRQSAQDYEAKKRKELADRNKEQAALDTEYRAALAGEMAAELKASQPRMQNNVHAERVRMDGRGTANVNESAFYGHNVSEDGFYTSSESTKVNGKVAGQADYTRTRAAAAVGNTNGAPATSYDDNVIVIDDNQEEGLVPIDVPDDDVTYDTGDATVGGAAFAGERQKLNVSGEASYSKEKRRSINTGRSKTEAGVVGTNRAFTNDSDGSMEYASLDASGMNAGAAYGVTDAARRRGAAGYKAASHYADVMAAQSELSSASAELGSITAGSTVPKPSNKNPLPGDDD